MPIITKQDIDVDKIEPWCYTKTKLNYEKNNHKTIRFLTYDWLFKVAYSKPEVAIDKLVGTTPC